MCYFFETGFQTRHCGLNEVTQSELSHLFLGFSVELQTLQHLLVPQDCIWPTVSQFVQIAQDYDSLDCILDMVLSLTQVMPQKYLI